MRTHAGLIPIPEDNSARSVLAFGIGLVLIGIMALLWAFKNRR